MQENILTIRYSDAAKIAGLSRASFLMRLGRYKVSPFQMELEETLGEAGMVVEEYLKAQGQS